MSARPPLVMQAGTWTTHYALLGRGVGFNGRGRMYVGATLLGRVPRRAIAATAAGRWWLMHCGRTWNVRTAIDYPSLADAQGRRRASLPRIGDPLAPHRLHAGACRGLRRPGQPRPQLQLLRPAARPVQRADVRRQEERGPRLRRLRRSLHVAAGDVRTADEQQERLLNTVSADRPVRFVLRSRFLALLDLATFDRHREALAGDGRRSTRMAGGARWSRWRRAASPCTSSSPFTPGLYRVRPADLEPVARTRAATSSPSTAARSCWPTSTPCPPSPRP